MANSYATIRATRVEWSEWKQNMLGASEERCKVKGDSSLLIVAARSGLRLSIRASRVEQVVW